MFPKKMFQMRLQELLNLHRKKWESRIRLFGLRLSDVKMMLAWWILLILSLAAASCYTSLVAKQRMLMLSLLSVHAMYARAIRCLLSCFCRCSSCSKPLPSQFFLQAQIKLVSLILCLLCVISFHVMADPWAPGTLGVSLFLHMLCELVIQTMEIQWLWSAVQAMRSVRLGEPLLDPQGSWAELRMLLGEMRDRGKGMQTVQLFPLDTRQSISLSFTYRADTCELANVLHFPLPLVDWILTMSGVVDCSTVEDIHFDADGTLILVVTSSSCATAFALRSSTPSKTITQMIRASKAKKCCIAANVEQEARCFLTMHKICSC
jgi:hypothetical protein